MHTHTRHPALRQGPALTRHGVLGPLASAATALGMLLLAGQAQAVPATERMTSLTYTAAGMATALPEVTLHEGEGAWYIDLDGDQKAELALEAVYRDQTWGEYVNLQRWGSVRPATELDESLYGRVSFAMAPSTGWSPSYVQRFQSTMPVGQGVTWSTRGMLYSDQAYSLTEQNEPAWIASESLGEWSQVGDTGYVAFRVLAGGTPDNPHYNYGWLGITRGSITLNSVSYTVSAPVPEPETYAMLLAGLGVVGAVARRRQRAG